MNDRIRKTQKKKVRQEREWMIAKRKYQFGRICGGLKIEVTHVKPIFGNVEFLRVCPIVNKSRNLRISDVCKDEDAVVMEVGTSKGEENLEVN
jgi:hypothetical protein